MGCAVDVVIVDGAPHLLDQARTAIDHLEQRWSRFLPESDISCLNHAAGLTSVPVDPATMVLLRAMVDGWRATSGAFDPTLLAPLVGLGYSASWHDPAAVTSLPHGAIERGDLDLVSMDERRNVVCLPCGMCLDAGGIGKGLAADLVVGQLLAAGTAGASVTIGGDVAARGLAPQPGGWVIGVASPRAPGEASQLLMSEGGVATSGTLRRRWRTDEGATVHHLLDPATRLPVDHSREILAVTVIAGTAAWAEVWTKAAMVRGATILRVLETHGLGAQLTYADATTQANESWFEFVRSGEQRADLVGDEVDMVEV